VEIAKKAEEYVFEQIKALCCTKIPYTFLTQWKNTIENMLVNPKDYFCLQYEGEDDDKEKAAAPEEEEISEDISATEFEEDDFNEEDFDEDDDKKEPKDIETEQESAQMFIFVNMQIIEMIDAFLERHTEFFKKNIVKQRKRAVLVKK